MVVLGAGYAGLFAARRASSRSKRRPVQVTLVDPATVWVERTRMHQIAAGDASVRRFPLATTLFKDTGMHIVAGRATSIDADGQTVEVEATDGTTSRLSYDRLVYALGSTSDTSQVPGAAAHTMVLDNTASSERLRDLLDELARTGGGRVAVVGGGLTGIESASEIAEAYPGLAVTLLTSDTMGNGLSERGRRYLVQALGRRKVTLKEHTRVESVEPGRIQTAEDHSIEADIVVWATGYAVPDLASRSTLATDERGRVLVDASLASTSHPTVYAAGDSAWPVEPVGVAAVRPSAYAASIMGAQAGANVADDLAGEPTKPLRFGYLMQSISLGRFDGLVQPTDGNDKPSSFVLTGRAAAGTKEIVERFVVVGLLRLERLVPGAYAWRPAPRAAA